MMQCKDGYDRAEIAAGLALGEQGIERIISLSTGTELGWNRTPIGTLQLLGLRYGTLPFPTLEECRNWRTIEGDIQRLGREGAPGCAFR